MTGIYKIILAYCLPFLFHIPLPKLHSMKPPKKWKMAVLIWLAIYPLITTVFAVFGKYLMMIEVLPLRTLCITIVLVPIMVFVLIPFLQKLLGGWLQK